MSYGYKDNYPHNIEAPQRVNFQYSHDIEFDYSQGRYPLGETHEGFLWEEVYIPVEHYVGAELVGKHVWMRTSVGLTGKWTLPIRLTDSFTNIEQSEIIYDPETGETSYRIKYTLADGSVIYSEPIVIVNGVDGVGIIDSRIVGDNLVLTYSDGTVDNVGRVTGYNGVGVPIGAPDGYHMVSIGNVATWQDFNTLLNSELSVLSPLDFSNSVITHLDTIGNRHIPEGDSDGDVLIADGIGNYTWVSLTDPITGYIPWTAIDDLAGIGDTDKLYSAEHITNLISGLSAFGIKYSVTTIVEMNAITGMVADELCIVNGEPNRPVYKYDGANWNAFFDLDADHSHPLLYTLTSDLEGNGTSSVHWNNITNAPDFLTNFGIAGDSGSGSIIQGEILSVLGGSGVTTSVAGNIITINATGTSYTADETSINLVGTEFRHANTSSEPDTTNTGGQVVQNLDFDTYGHVVNALSLNLDTRYSLLAHTHYTLTNGLGLTGNNYNGGSAQSWAVDFSGDGSANTVSRSDHNHIIGNHSLTLFVTWDIGSYINMTKQGVFVNFRGRLSESSGSIANRTVVEAVNNPYPPGSGVSFLVEHGGNVYTIWVYHDGRIATEQVLPAGFDVYFSFVYYDPI